MILQPLNLPCSMFMGAAAGAWLVPDTYHPDDSAAVGLIEPAVDGMTATVTSDSGTPANAPLPARQPSAHSPQTPFFLAAVLARSGPHGQSPSCAHCPHPPRIQHE